MKITKYILFVATLFMAVGCYKFDEYNSEGSASASAPSLTMTASLGTVMDSTIVLDFASDKDGYISYALMADSVVMDAQTLMEKRVADALALNQIKVSANVNSIIEFTELMPNTEYYVYAVASTDGFWSEISSQLVQTDDGEAPLLLADKSSPEISSDAALEIDQAISITFSEPIVRDASKKITFKYLLEGVEVEVPEDNISVNGATLIIQQPQAGHLGDYVFVSLEEGTVKDLAGNPCAARVSDYISGTGFVGNFYRYVFENFSINEEKCLPEPNTGQANLDSIMLKFNSTVNLPLNADYTKNIYTSGDLKISVTTEGKVSTYDVPLSAISVNDSTATIYIADVVTVNPGETLSLEFIEGVFTDDYDNSVAAYPAGDAESFSWLKSYGYTRDLIIGTYTATCTSYWGGDTTYTVTITEQATSTDTVYFVGLVGSTDSIKGVFDGILGTIEFEEQNITLPGSSKAYVVSNGLNAPSYTNEGTIASNGDMTVTWGVYNITDDGWWDLYPNSSWIKN